MKAIEVKNVSFAYDREDVICDVSFSVEQGTYTTIIGHNGSGKSTVAKLIIGLLEARTGEILVEDYPLNLENLYTIRDKVGIVFQNPDNQFIGSTVRDDIAFGLENHCVDHDRMDPLIEEFSEKVGMQEYLNSEPTKLSGGQKQRVAIAGVLAMSPDILIFDESTSMLDPQGKAEINALIQQIHEEKNLTIVSITHDIEEVAASDHVIVLNKGKVALDGTPEEVLNKEKTLYELQLDIPFSLKWKHALEKEGITVKETLDVKGMVDELCRLRSKK
ncbi:MAG: energy-coupling factor transporter ATPase [Erysipelotrichaceae bacterium]|nr:energy-coupling factor transporter ATPase [Erysipelotrichaceae bacterium]